MGHPLLPPGQHLLGTPVQVLDNLRIVMLNRRVNIPLHHNLPHQLLQIIHIPFHIEQHLIQNFPLRSKGILRHPLPGNQRRQPRGTVFRQVPQQRSRRNNALLLNNRQLLGNILQLPHIPRPLIFQHHLPRILTQRYGRHPVILRKIGCKFPEYQQNIVPAVP